MVLVRMINRFLQHLHGIIQCNTKPSGKLCEICQTDIDYYNKFKFSIGKYITRSDGYMESANVYLNCL